MLLDVAGCGNIMQNAQLPRLSQVIKLVILGLSCPRLTSFSLSIHRGAHGPLYGDGARELLPSLTCGAFSCLTD
jgi:hypothetical protein